PTRDRTPSVIREGWTGCGATAVLDCEAFCSSNWRLRSSTSERSRSSVLISLFGISVSIRLIRSLGQLLQVHGGLLLLVFYLLSMIDWRLGPEQAVHHGNDEQGRHRRQNQPANHRASQRSVLLAT